MSESWSPDITDRIYDLPCRVESLTRTRSLADRADGVPELAAAHRDLHEQEQGSCQTEKGIPRNKQRGPSAAYICICQRFRFAEAVRFRLLQIGVLRARCDFFLCIRRTKAANFHARCARRNRILSLCASQGHCHNASQRSANAC